MPGSLTHQQTNHMALEMGISGLAKCFHAYTGAMFCFMMMEERVGKILDQLSYTESAQH